MQTLSLYSLLKREVPESIIEIIDYSPQSLRDRHRRLGLYAFRPPFFNPRYIWSYFSQIAFLRRRCSFSRRRLVSDDPAAARRFIAAQGYDAVVVGSDNVWEVGGSPPPPNVYFQPLNDLPTFAFAPSADPAPTADSPWCGEAAGLGRALDRFDVLTVRDEGTRDFLCGMGIAPDRIGYLPDPTILSDFTDLPVAGPERAQEGRPVAALAASPALARAIRGALGEAGFDVFSLMGGRQLSNVTAAPYFSTIRQRLSFYPTFDLTITDRFHMSVFALKLGRGPVIFLEDAARWPRRGSKGRDLLARLGLEDMVWRLDPGDVSVEKLREMLDAWPRLSAGLRDRLVALRMEAERTGYCGIAPALRAIADRRHAEGTQPQSPHHSLVAPAGRA